MAELTLLNAGSAGYAYGNMLLGAFENGDSGCCWHDLLFSFMPIVHGYLVVCMASQAWRRCGLSVESVWLLGWKSKTS